VLKHVYEFSDLLLFCPCSVEMHGAKHSSPHISYQHLIFKHLCLLVQCTQLSRELAVQVSVTEPQGSIEHSLRNAGV